MWEPINVFKQFNNGPFPLKPRVDNAQHPHLSASRHDISRARQQVRVTFGLYRNLNSSRQMTSIEISIYAYMTYNAIFNVGFLRYVLIKKIDNRPTFIQIYMYLIRKFKVD